MRQRIRKGSKTFGFAGWRVSADMREASVRLGVERSWESLGLNRRGKRWGQGASSLVTLSLLAFACSCSGLLAWKSPDPATPIPLTLYKVPEAASPAARLPDCGFLKHPGNPNSSIPNAPRNHAHIRPSSQVSPYFRLYGPSELPFWLLPQHYALRQLSGLGSKGRSPS